MLFHIWISFHLSLPAAVKDVSHQLQGCRNPSVRWNSTVLLRGVFFVAPRHKNRRRQEVECEAAPLHSLFRVTSVGEEEDNDARQQHHHHHHGCQEEGSAQRPARQPEQSPANAARLAVTHDRRAGKPNVQRAVRRPLTPSLVTFR